MYTTLEYIYPVVIDLFPDHVTHLLSMIIELTSHVDRSVVLCVIIHV